MVGPVTVAPGKVNAAVQGSRPRPYRSSVHLPVLTDPQWDTLLDTIAARAGHLAALLDDEMPAELVDDARHAGVPLLPLPAELDPECSCPDWGHPCKHAAALCYAIAATIDTDPFVLFALRGRGRGREGDLRPAARTPHGSTGHRRPTRHRPAYRPQPRTPTGPKSPPNCPNSRNPPPTPQHCPSPRHPAAGLAAADLERLMADATARAARLLAGDTADLYLTQHQDAVRIAASNPGPEWFTT